MARVFDESYENVAGNYYDKYNSRNPIVKRLMKGFLEAFLDLTTLSGARKVYECGCGEGELSIRLLRLGYELNGFDIEDDMARRANERAAREGYGARFQTSDLLQLNSAEVAADLVVCCEVLEHIPDYRRALAVLCGIRCNYLLLSVPREPIWRIMNIARMRYVFQGGNTPGHVNHWSKKGFLTLLERDFELVEVRSPVPWTMALCKTKRFPGQFG